MDSVDNLQQLGFSQYEAQAYIALLRENPLNGYELAKSSGIPRANIYSVLQKLEEAGAVMRMEASEGVRYAPTPADELLDKLKRRYQQSLDTAQEELRKIAPPAGIEAVLNIRGYAELLDNARSLLDRTKKRLLISIWPEEAAALAGPVQQARERGAEIATLCLRACPQACPACQGTVFRYALAPGSSRWLILVSDGSELLTGEISASGAAAVRTRQPMLVNLTASYIQNSAALASIVSDVGGRLQSELDPQTLASLDALRPDKSQGAWLEIMRQTLHPESIG